MPEEYTRVRNKTIAFHVTEEEYATIKMLAEISGLEKQDYLITRAMQKDFVVQPNIRVRHYLEAYLQELIVLLKSNSIYISGVINDKAVILLNTIAQL